MIAAGQEWPLGQVTTQHPRAKACELARHNQFQSSIKGSLSPCQLPRVGQGCSTQKWTLKKNQNIAPLAAQDMQCEKPA